jgi:hypothetical protein
VIRAAESRRRRMRWAVHVGRMGNTGYAYRVLLRKLEKKRPPGRPRYK